MSSVFLYDRGRRLRIRALRASWPEILDLPFDQIRVAGVTRVAVMLRLDGVIGDLASATESPRHRRALLGHVDGSGLLPNRG